MALFATPEYEAEAQVAISLQAPVLRGAVAPRDAAERRLFREYLRTQVAVARSPDVLARASLAWPGGLPKTAGRVPDGLHTWLVPDSHLIAISFRHRDPGRAAAVVNGVAEAYRSHHLDTWRGRLAAVGLPARSLEGHVRVVRRASPPPSPVWPPRTLLVFGGAIVGLTLGFVLLLVVAHRRAER